MKTATISWTFGLENLDELFAKVKEIGFDALQFCGDFKKYPASEVKKKAHEYQIELIGYDPLECKPSKESESTLEHSINFYKDVIDYALEIGAPMVTIQGLSFWCKSGQTYQEALEQIIQATKELSIYAEGKEMTLTYEACNHYETPWIHTAEELLLIQRNVLSENLKLVLDSFHMNINEKDSIEAIQSIGGKLLFSYHVSDSGRGGIDTGHIDYPSQFKALKDIDFKGIICFEIVTKEVRPFKFPMNKNQMEDFVKQSTYSLQKWNELNPWV